LPVPFVIAGVVAFAVVVVIIRAFLHMVMTHMLVSAVTGGIGVPLLIFVVVAFIRGLGHHTKIIMTAIEPPKPRPQLPAPAEVQPVPVREVKKLDPWTADGETWEAIVDRAERDELLRSGPREARIVRFGGCEGPACHEALDDRPWTIEVEGDDGQAGTHSFCSRECAERWQDHDYQKRAGRSGEVIQ
jgi:hypothetical protein